MLARKIYYLQKVQRQQWFSQEKMKDLQDRKLREVVRHAYRYVPYYRRQWKSLGIGPEDIRTTEDLDRLPILTRDEIKINQKDLLSKAYDSGGLHHVSTSGSTGSQLHAYFDGPSFDYLDAVYLRALLAVGYRPWQRLAYFWYPPFRKDRFYERLGIMKKHWIPSTTDDETQLRMLMKIDPQVIYSFPSTLLILSKMMSKRGLSLSPRIIISHAELLTKEHRRHFESVFGCDVYDQYGSTEFNRMGWDCSEHSGFHVDADSIFMEILKDGDRTSTGERGSVVVTGIVNMAMPLIRYDIGDIGEFSNDECGCGRGLPLMKIIEGRSDDFVVLPDGRLIGPRDIFHSIFPILNRPDEIFKIRIVQNDRHAVKVEIVEGKKFSKRTLGDLSKTLDDVFEKKLNVSVESVSDIGRNRHGKLRAVESKVRS